MSVFTSFLAGWKKHERMFSYMMSTCSSILAPMYRKPFACASRVPALRPPLPPKVGSIHKPVKRWTLPLVSCNLACRTNVARSARSVSLATTFLRSVLISFTTKLACRGSLDLYESSFKKILFGNRMAGKYPAFAAAEAPIGT